MSQPTTVTCPACSHSFEINAGELLGKRRTPKKAKSSARNGKLGGYPKGKPRKKRILT